jgi:hypothetical protein
MLLCRKTMKANVSASEFIYGRSGNSLLFPVVFTWGSYSAPQHLHICATVLAWRQALATGQATASSNDARQVMSCQYSPTGTIVDWSYKATGSGRESIPAPVYQYQSRGSSAAGGKDTAGEIKRSCQSRLVFTRVEMMLSRNN